MAANSSIEWTDSTFNPWIGCTKISPACDHCYAEAHMDTRLGRVKWGAGQQRQRTSAGNWRQPVRWNACSFWQCDTCGWRGENPHLDGLLDEGAQVRNMCPGCWPALVAVKPARRRVFCASLADWLDNEAPVEWLADLLELIRITPNLDWLQLTKRIGNWRPRLTAVAAHVRSQINAQAERAVGLPAGSVRGTGDRPAWAGLEGGEASSVPMDRRHAGGPLQEGSRGVGERIWVSSGEGDAERGPALRSGAPAGMGTQQRSDTGRTYDQPQGWSEVEQLAGQPGAGNLQRPTQPRDSGARGETLGRQGIEAPKDQPHGIAGNRDSGATRSRGESEGLSVRVRINTDSGFRDRPSGELEALLTWVERWLAGEPPANVWLGATICNQPEADRDVIKLLRTPAAKRFVSVEPMLGPIRLWKLGALDFEEDSLGAEVYALSGTRAVPDCDWQGTKLDWVICGGESGPKARPTHPDWPRSLRDQCGAAGVPFMLKQWGEWTPGENVTRRRGTVRTATWWDGEWSYDRENLSSDDGHIDDEPDLYCVGKRAAGRLLDGQEHNGFPVGVS